MRRNSMPGDFVKARGVWTTEVSPASRGGFFFFFFFACGAPQEIVLQDMVVVVLLSLSPAVEAAVLFDRAATPPVFDRGKKRQKRQDVARVKAGSSRRQDVYLDILVFQFAMSPARCLRRQMLPVGAEGRSKTAERASVSSLSCIPPPVLNSFACKCFFGVVAREAKGQRAKLEIPACTDVRRT